MEEGLDNLCSHMSGCGSGDSHGAQGHKERLRAAVTISQCWWGWLSRHRDAQPRGFSPHVFLSQVSAPKGWAGSVGRGREPFRVRGEGTPDTGVK